MYISITNMGSDKIISSRDYFAKYYLPLAKDIRKDILWRRNTYGSLQRSAHDNNPRREPADIYILNIPCAMHIKRARLSPARNFRRTIARRYRGVCFPLSFSFFLFFFFDEARRSDAHNRMYATSLTSAPTRVSRWRAAERRVYYRKFRDSEQHHKTVLQQPRCYGGERIWSEQRATASHSPMFFHRIVKRRRGARPSKRPSALSVCRTRRGSSSHGQAKPRRRRRTQDLTRISSI